MTAIEPKRVGIIGAGYISAVYLKSNFPQFKIVACADAIPENANVRAKDFGIKAMSVNDLLADPSIEVILNLTIPKAMYRSAEPLLTRGNTCMLKNRLVCPEKRLNPFWMRPPRKGYGSAPRPI